MTTDLSNLRPSGRLGTIPAEVLRDRPVPGVYCWSGLVIQIVRWSGSTPRGRTRIDTAWSGEDVLPLSMSEVHYPILPALTFTMTREQMATPGEQPSGRMKSITRRKSCPKWCKPRALFNAWDRSFRAGKGKARYLGTYRVVSVERQQRWACPHCGDFDGTGGGMCCAETENAVDTIAPAELALEGFPEMAADDFWGLLEKAGNVRDGKTWRIAFEAV